MRFIYYIFFLLICGNNLVFSQQISVDSSVGLQQLIEDNLVDGCVDISNITSSVNGNNHGLPSYGYFERASSNFPFENGIMLSTGSAASGGNGVITPTLSESSTNWGTDPDLETALGITNTLNATSIEFDIVSISNQIQFNYLFASEDYDGINPCLVSDGFVFLIRETTSTGPYQNIALVPGTSDPVNTNYIRPNLLPACAPQNEQYFDGYNIGDTNYVGRTTVLTASTTITPNVQYHIKIIIADQNDGTFDSAVFIEGDSFKILDLGDDIATCAGATILNADIQNPLATYAWYWDNNLISGAINPTYNAIQSGTYRVQVTVDLNGTSCVEEDDINVTLNTEEPITPISDYQLCDDISGNGIEVFDLSTKNTELIANIPFSNYTFTYHYSDGDARSNINSITTTISNTISPQPIYVRIEDFDSNCFAYTTFNLIVNPVPNITAPTDLEICDEDNSPDGFAIIDLTQKDDAITNNQNNLIVSYHYSPADANTGNNPISSPYVNTNTPTDIVYVRVIDALTGCINTATTLSVNVTVSPIVNRDTQYLDACDRDLDGTANFNLNDVLNDILGGLTGVTPTFHESYDDANNGTNAIADASNYQNINLEEQTIYVRIESDTTGCASIVPLEIHTNLLITGTDLGDFALCDTNDDDSDTLEFNLTSVESSISNDLPNPVTVTFYETEPDRDSNTAPIPKGVLYSATSPKVLYVSLDDGNCTEVGMITLLVNPILQFNPANPIPYCDTDDDGIVSIDLHSLDNLVTNGNTNFAVTYFPTALDADNNNTANQLPPFYTNTNPIESIFARITNNDTGCATTNFFEIQINLAPPATQPTPFLICDTDQDGFSIINLEDKINEVVADPTGLDIDFFTSFDDANSFINVISDATIFNATTQTVYIRVAIESTTNATEECYNIVALEVIINTLPNIPAIDNFQICQTGGGSTADFILADKDAEILNGQTGKEVFYFSDDTFMIPIPKNTIYQNTSSPQTIYVRVENITDATCSDTASFILQVSPDPVYNVPTPYLRCDDISNDGIDTFNLNEKIIEIQGPNPPEVLNITFHLTRDEAENNNNALPPTYTNTRNPQTLYVRIESDDSLCHVIEEVNINIIASPDITNPSILTRCDEDYDGETTFNLTTADFQILDRIQINLIVNYFENLSDINQNDGLDNTNEIPAPSSFISNAKTVYIKVANTLTGCFSIVPLELEVNLPPPTNNIGTIPICDNDTDTFDLSTVDTMIVGDTSLVNISYHNTQADADNNLAPLSNIFDYTASSHTIFIRVSDLITGCFIAPSFTLQINQNPIANALPDLIDCDDDFDGLLEFDLPALTTNTILGAQNASDFSITYYNDPVNAEAGTGAIDNNYLAFDGETIYARIENNITGCFDTTQFATRINPLPVIPIDDIIPLCIDNLPLVISADTGYPDDTYLWSTGATTPEIMLDAISDIGDYLVTVTRPYITGGCPHTHPFSVIESEAATINFTTTVDFADPNSITVDINTSNIGNYVFILDDGEPQTSPVFENVTYGVHTVIVRDLNGCMDVSQNVVVIDVPKFVTPNSDGYHDTWHIVGIEQLPGTMVHIYNRHGKLIKTLAHTSIGWDGTYNGHNMPSDDYWFSADVIQNGNAFNVRGHFALKR